MAVFAIAPIFLLGSSRTVTITVVSNPGGPNFVSIDGVNVTTPITEEWSPGSIHQLEALSPIPGSSGVSYTWIQWSDNGSQNQSYKVPDTSQTVSATYASQYEVTFSVNTTGGVITPSGSKWYNAGAVAPISTTANPGYSFTSWTESGSISISDISSASTNATINGPGTISANFESSSTKGSQPSSTSTTAPNVSIIISSNPAGSGFIEVDGVMQVTPYSVSWSVGSTHTLEALSNVKNGTGVQYVWTDWSNGATQANTYTVPSSSATITADFKTQYLLTVKTNGLPSPYTTAVSVGVQQVGKVDDATPITEWLDASSQTGTIEIDNTVISGATGTQYVFTNWSPGNSAVNPRSSTTVISPLTLTANYETQYQVTFDANPSNGGLTTPVAGTGWYDSSNQITISAAPASYKNLFALWTTAGNITVASATSSYTTATINGPGNITANFQSTIIYITINAIPSNLPEIIIDGQYYPPSTITGQPFEMVMGTNNTIEAPSPYPMGTGTQYVYGNWSNGGPQTQNYIVPSSNATLTVTYTVQYELTMSGNYGTVYPANSAWCNAGSSVNIYAVSPSVGTGERYVWDGWTGSGSGSYTGNVNYTALTINAPINETASWTHQYLHTLSYSVVDGGSPSAPTATGTSMGAVYTVTLTTKPTDYWFDASGSINFSTPTVTNEQWVPVPASVSATQSNTQVVSMYNQYKQILSYTVVDGGSPSAPTATGTSLGAAYTPTLTTSATGYWFDASGSITFSTPASGSTERWAPSPASISATHSNTQVVSMYNQYLQTLSYQVVDGGSPTAPTANGLSLGAAYAPSLTTSATGYWFDASGSITFSTPTSGSTEQWSPNLASISATQPNNQVVSMYNQYLQTLSCTVVDGGSPSAPTATGTSLGSAYAPTLTNSATGYWFDASGSITFSTPASGSSERWSPNPASISATSAHTQVISMYNQYLQTLSYQVVDGGSPSAATATGTSLGSSYVPTLTTTATGYWFDASGFITFSTPASGSTERWAPSPASISATQSNTQVISMYNQYMVTASYSTSDGSTPSSSITLSGTQFGS
ncbi:MAG TPA: hypothetical protein VK536_04665, partial [Candidatus Limnocylindrales bacterium]|nr:hypothetical protein [Candidatus Limnocylindrales bacterium]